MGYFSNSLGVWEIKINVYGFYLIFKIYDREKVF